MVDDRSVFILLTNTGTLFTKVIQGYTRAPYNHASISFNRELSELYSFGRKNPNNPLNGGFVKEDLRTGTFSKYPNTTCVIYELRVSERDIEKMKRVLQAFIRKDKKYFYNILGVLGIALKEPIEFSNSYFCSQFVAEILHRSGVRLWDKLPALVTPDDFRQSERLNLIYEGKLSEYEA
ncbi:hypothetical protein PVOR_01220 [Paenibacillus vortex V453]|jgi:hypothetical protein|uniref:Uncharacterized protein n=2 Tax=Paenibacillus TaxID=44249 RepID=A0A163IQY5_9BACL|nr:MULTISPECIES: hypothetical protein [Paenibacillus]ANA80071.1 hypothetical protein A3958_08795 [Paenibacillus glucanolyticus]AVV55904.1 hypothetical protein C7121_07015 [Paenibacillus glucanolyticus]AWP30436.1 hypothetical protein B9D94_29220 [Paenibacillus sp. Cedars]EFU43793.1 hypothetical protein PVOR_01220 [Paenibacillus vortex V453]ETT38462.1 hypothetical protein C169_12647 [Paenibacillus sp. FSL R5-808]